MLLEILPNSQITIPNNILKALNLSVGDTLAIKVKKGVIVLTPLVAYPKGYLEELRTEVNKVKAQIAAGEQPTFDTVDDMFDQLETHRVPPDERFLPY